MISRATIGAICFMAGIWPSYLTAHSGGLNAQGCHAGSQPYHCHRSQAPQSNLSGSGGRDMDCADFSSWRQAQDFYERFLPNDPHGLDRDRDGVACESLR